MLLEQPVSEYTYIHSKAILKQLVNNLTCAAAYLCIAYKQNCQISETESHRNKKSSQSNNKYENQTRKKKKEKREESNVQQRQKIRNETNVIINNDDGGILVEANGESLDV